MTDFERLHCGSVVDVRVRSTRKRHWWQLEPAVNALLARAGCWRLGRAGGRRALLHIVPPYRHVLLWPWPKGDT